MSELFQAVLLPQIGVTCHLLSKQSSVSHVFVSPYVVRQLSTKWLVRLLSHLVSSSPMPKFFNQADSLILDYTDFFICIGLE